MSFFFKLKDDNIGEKKVPQLRGVSISDNAPAFQRSVNNLATLAYATEGNLLRGILNFKSPATFQVNKKVNKQVNKKVNSNDQ